MTEVISVFFVDIDGCLSEPFLATDWKILSELRMLSEQSHVESSIPKLCLCTGRPAPYAEAVSQWLDIRYPALFESGVGMLDISSQEARYHPQLPLNHLSFTDVVRDYFQGISETHKEVQFETSKHVGVGFTCANKELVLELLPEIEQFVASNCSGLEVHNTEISIEVVWSVANKGAGIQWFCSEHGLSTSNVAFIGDSSADAAALRIAAIGIAPNNANSSAKEAADLVTKSSVAAGVLEAWRLLIELNEKA